MIGSDSVYSVSYPSWTFYDPAQYKRQTATFHTPACLSAYSSAYGDVGITSACDCLAIQTPSPVTSTTSVPDPSITATSSVPENVSKSLVAKVRCRDVHTLILSYVNITTTLPPATRTTSVTTTSARYSTTKQITESVRTPQN